VGIGFKRVARAYWFDPAGLALEENDQVVVETGRGVEIGTVRIAPREVPEHQIQRPLKSVLRRADERDLEQDRRNKERARFALTVCAEGVRRLELPMRLLHAEYEFDGSQVTIYFSAPSRVDFRELVRVVAPQLRSKVQLHQVRARDQAKMTGGVGPCGLALCCATFLTDFAPVSMRMAKDQSLFLNPIKFSGVCGKLMCCLRYEHETYVDAKKRMPPIGAVVTSPKGQGRVVELNVLKGSALIQLDESKAELEFPAAEIRVERTADCSACRSSCVPEENDCADI
jgi:cell fate regulator YaaT (PSP1 superfamily)